MLERRAHRSRLRSLLREYRVVGLLGARQVGKTTLALQLAETWKGPVHRFDLEDSRDLARLADPMLALAELRGLVILDEVQRRPDLFPTLRVLADRPRGGARFLVLGGASPDLLRQTSESLAGRIQYYPLPGFSLDEVGTARLARLWLRGGLPLSFQAGSEAKSLSWRNTFIATFLQRDLPELGFAVSSETLRRFWSMLAHYHGQIWNAAEFARSFGVSAPTVHRYLDMLVSTFVVRRLQPWHENIKKRQVKSPKVYFSDTGLLHALLNLPTAHDLEGHPKVGASWEGFALGEVMRGLRVAPDECWFWATHQGAELDLLVVRGRRRLAFEFKRTAAPSLTRSMKIALEDLRLTRLDVIHAGSDTFPLAKKVRAVALRNLVRDLKRLL